ncbi:MAG: hypothetical protein Q4P66_05770 [Actinomycetaceae bacterium]|nr:hypothetical protein [Actinomycetaceae bacterium]
MDNIHYKCPGCAAPIDFDPGSAAMECIFCGSTYSVEEFYQATDGAQGDIPQPAPGPLYAPGTAPMSTTSDPDTTHSYGCQASPSMQPPPQPYRANQSVLYNDSSHSYAGQQATMAPPVPPQGGVYQGGSTSVPARQTSTFSWDEPEMDYMSVSDTQGLAQSTCNSCGASVIGPPDVISTVCPYCHNNVISLEAIRNTLSPQVIIPLKITKEQALNTYEQSSKGKWFLPKEFNTNAIVDKLQPMYTPYWLYSCQVHSDVVMTAIKSTTRTTDDEVIRTDYYYRVERSGNMVFNNIPISATTTIEDKYTEAIEPYDYQELTTFSPPYLSGIRSMMYSIGLDESTPKANTRVSDSIEDVVTQDLHYDRIVSTQANTKMLSSEISYALLPMWMMNVDYAGKRYTFAINGQTGKIVGDYPISRLKKLLWQLVIGFPSAIATAATLWMVLG